MLNCQITLRVIYVLSTIVAVADCCSSRILLIKERSLKVVQPTYLDSEDFTSNPNHNNPNGHKQLAQLVDVGESTPMPPTPFSNTNSTMDSNTETTAATAVDTTVVDVDVVVEQYASEPVYMDTTTTTTATAETTSFASMETVDFEVGDTTTDATMTTDAVTATITVTAQRQSQSDDIMDLTAAVSDPPATTESSTTTFAPVTTPTTFVDAVGDLATREEHAGNPKYHVIDLYYTIMRDVLSFECSGQYLTDFCLNNGRCFRYPVGNHSFFSCECADGYVGERCESKSLNTDVYVNTPTAAALKQHKIFTARAFFSFPTLIVISAIYLTVAAICVFFCPQKQRAERRQLAR